MKIYNELLQLTTTTLSRNDLCQRISKLNASHLQNIYLLIVHHCALNNIEDIGALPMGNNTVKFDTSKFPPPLLAILSNYLDYVC